ncbi:MAG: phosphoribosylformylglycinamidine synthase [Defluviitaleaceae bacterium]|nr:phosphoribosylformylglycinamidine synthase [Defluviitaleaceae bacterium]
MINRCYVEKLEGFDVAAKSVENELSEILNLQNVSVRIFNRYDIQNLPQSQWEYVKNTVLSEPMGDICYEKLPDFAPGVFVLCAEPLPGQFDMRADSCEQCIQMLLGGERPSVKTAKVFAISLPVGTDTKKIEDFLINPLEYRKVVELIYMSEAELKIFHQERGMAMSLADLLMIQAYFIKEQRDPTPTELQVIDTYWSDHCRHTTFNTVIKSADIGDKRVSDAYDLFLQVNGKKPPTFMNMATAAARHLLENGKLPMLDISEENNACTIRIKVDFPDGQGNPDGEDWLLYFKNETHNHPTEIEPFGGASTCIGGAIRDPLSGRAYVYHAMRISGAGDPRTPIEKTLAGKLPQRKITVTAAEGFSSYGNQIGIATGFVKEIYHEGYVAKRLETGAVVGAAPLSYVRRETPADGDIVILLGGRTGRDGIGGATGSSKTHSTQTVSECASEVQKGNAPEERKLQRLFKNPDVTRLIKRCNDFGAGGVAVAVGELADGLEINLDAIPTKYDGLTGTELAVSESQERMAIVVEEKDVEALLTHAKSENIEASIIARITKNKRLIMTWRGQKIVDLAREFLDTNGAERCAKIHVPPHTPYTKPTFRLDDLNFCSQKGLVQRFDSTIGNSAVFVPLGGKWEMTETQAMASLLPAKGTSTASVMAYGFDADFTETDPFGGSAYAVTTSVAKLIACGVALDTVHLSLQEYFPRLYDDPTRWGKPFAAMLGAFSAQMGLKIAAIGGKDSMSGSFGDLDVPSTLISFAVGVADASVLISPDFKSADNPVYLLETPLTAEDLPDYNALRGLWQNYTKLIAAGKILSAWACETGGIHGGIIKMSLGNKIGFKSECDFPENQWGSIIFEASEKIENFPLLGYTQSTPTVNSTPIEKLIEDWQKPLENIFPVKVKQTDAPVISSDKKPTAHTGKSFARPKAIIPVFPGTNCEYDTAAAIERAGGTSEIILVRNLTPQALEESILAMEKAIANAQMIIFPGGFSGGDEPDGSGKFIVSLFRNPRLTNAVHELINKNDGLILGICNGFQALIKLGLVPYGQIKSAMTPDCPTLTFNSIGRHQSRYVSARVASVASPWLSECKVGEVYTQPISHGEGRFFATDTTLDELKANGQIAFQYVDENPNGSVWAIEGITSPCGRVLGKMAHTERYGEFTAKNIPGNKFLPLFEGGIRYFM